MAGIRPSLKELILAAAIAPKPVAEFVAAPPKVRVGKITKAITARLVANEYLRNGLDIKRAYEDVTHKKYHLSRFRVMIAQHDNAFLSEIDLALRSADVEKNHVLALLWAQATTSPLDFMDDNGVVLPIAELKKLPRELQALIEVVKVTTTYVAARDTDGKPVMSDDGVPLMVPEQFVYLKFPSKQAALNTIAQIGKLIGPSVLIQTSITNIGQIMLDADSRRTTILAERPERVIEHKP